MIFPFESLSLILFGKTFKNLLFTTLLNVSASPILSNLNNCYSCRRKLLAKYDANIETVTVGQAVVHEVVKFYCFALKPLGIFHITQL